MNTVTLQMNTEYSDKFYKNVLTRDDGHWIWRGSVTKGGYGRIMINREQIQATQLSYMVTCNKSLANIKHLRMVKMCPIKLCVNPLHIDAQVKKY